MPAPLSRPRQTAARRGGPWDSPGARWPRAATSGPSGRWRKVRRQTSGGRIAPGRRWLRVWSLDASSPLIRCTRRTCSRSASLATLSVYLGGIEPPDISDSFRTCSTIRIRNIGRSPSLISTRSASNVAGQIVAALAGCGYLPRAERTPRRHQIHALNKQVAAVIGPLGRVGDAVRQRVLGHLTRKGRRLAGPIAERAAHAVDRGAVLAVPHVAQDVAQRRVADAAAALQAGEDMGARLDRLHALEHGDRRVAQRDAVCLALLHPRRRHGPALGLPVELLPPCAARLLGASGSQHDHLDAGLCDAVALAQLGEEAGYLGPRQRRVMPHLAQLALRRVARVEVAPPQRRVVALAQAVRLGRVENALQPAAQP